MSLRQSKYGNIPQYPPNGMMGIAGSIRYVIQTVSNLQFYFVLLSKFHIRSYIRLPTSKTSKMFSNLLSVHRQRSMAINAIKTEYDSFVSITIRQSKRFTIPKRLVVFNGITLHYHFSGNLNRSPSTF